MKRKYQKIIEFEVNNEKYRFHMLDQSNLIIEQWKEKKVKGKPVMEWVRVSGFHNFRSIQRELLELVSESEAETLEQYFADIKNALTDISRQLQALID